MEEKKKTPDRRVMRTKRAIKSAFVRLLTEKHINDITVSDIAALADINRKTFYNYYAGVYEVVDEIENEIVSRLDEMLTEIDFKNNMDRPYMVFEKLTAAINTDRDFFGYLMQTDMNVSLTAKLIGLLTAKVKAILMQYVKTEEHRIDLMLEFMIPGMVAVYRRWFNSDNREPIEELSAEINLLSFRGLNGYLNLNLDPVS